MGSKTGLSLSAVPGVQAKAGEQEGRSAHPVQGAGHVSAGEGPVQADGQPAERAPPGAEEEVPGAHREWASFGRPASAARPRSTVCFLLVSGRRPVVTAGETQPGELPFAPACLSPAGHGGI